ncbi:MarR family transcriptional regulator [Agromyces protaetiae]|uniref:MarR family transcriptional regulator n=1 Tax=Agromyces protaetiae TaxID=2509455 RepID=A0A4P6FFE5_9MICO|nr:MarR family winged helix-turn-helix transcriptional regulator [Agromyces protaetiae]QAY72477.1 MarR family transcriptional regulator [Agromyces protaetiae]
MDDAIPQVEYETMLLSRHLIAIRPRRNAEERLDRSAYLLLSRIGIDGALSIGELSDAFGLDASTLNRQTAALVRAGFAERIPDPDGGIARKFRITDKGALALDEERTANVAAVGRILDGWEPDEVAEFAAYLHRFNTGIERIDRRPWPRPGTPPAGE